VLASLAAPVVALGGGDLGVAGETLHHGDVGACVEQVAHEGPPHVVRRDVDDARARGDAREHVCDRRLVHARVGRAPALAHGAEERPLSLAAHCEPRIDLGPGLGDEGAPLLVPLAHHAERPGAAVEVIEREPDQLAAAEAGDAEHGQEGGVTRAGRRVGAGAEERAQLAELDMTAGGETAAAEALDVGDQGVVGRSEQTEAHRFAGNAAEGGEGLVDGGGGAVLGKAGAESGDVGVAERAPGDRVRARGAQGGGDDGE
jgi:hypothetical protein